MIGLAEAPERVRLHVLFGIPHAMVRTAAAGDHSVKVKNLAKEGDKRLNNSVRQKLSDWERPKSERAKYEANGTLAWFLRNGTDMDAYVEPGSQHSDHSYGTMFECMLQLAPNSLREAIMTTYMVWVTERRSSEFDRLIVKQDPETSVEVWRWETGEVLDETALRATLARLHQAFVSSRLGDVQEELEVMAAIAASAAPPGGPPLDSAWIQQEEARLAENNALLAAIQEREKKERLTGLQARDPGKNPFKKTGRSKNPFILLQAKNDPNPKQELEREVRLRCPGGVTSHVLDRPGGVVHLSPFVCTVTISPPSGAPVSFVGDPSIAKGQAVRNGFWAALAGLDKCGLGLLEQGGGGN